MTGTVYLVGAGPGDPGLLTLRAAELIARADVLVYDALVSPAILERATAPRRIYVGKRGGEHSRTQDEINDILVELAREHRCVVRLKGGDPFVFGRGGEEALILARAGVPFEVVPGVTAGIAAPAYAGIPVTQRGMAASVAFVTGHEDPTKAETDVDWAHLARGVGTVVFYMGVGRMAENFRRLVEAGRAADTPAAAIEWGTYPRQRTVTGTLATLPDIAREAGIGAPSLIVVGEVASLRDQLAWWDRRPLSGKRIVVTRARAQASEFAAALEALGAETVQFPTVRIDPPADPEPLRRAAAGAGSFHWIVFTSANGVQHFWAALEEGGGDARSLAGVRVCAIGPATAAALKERGVRADLVPGEYVGEAAAEALLAAGPVGGLRILLPRADLARAAVPDRLRAAGADVVEVEAYRTVQDGAGADTVRRMLERGEVDAVTFTAASTVRNFVQLVGAGTGGALVASIGPVTSAAARELGLQVDVEAAEYTIPGLLAAIRERLGSQSGTA
ncbi:uroporphyrinogen-III C-methyltransferase [Longimicrobium sp.]|uniref:uroporphyrinogen-III C-methyltransferase n=1 Tax=Longimicrobium sp. TaxID=2029185 RepID=UPI002ED7FEC0